MIALAVACATAEAATRFDPLLKFRVMQTPHFRIYFDQRSAWLAMRLEIIAEETWARVERLGVRAPRMTHVVIADQTELPNAYATPLPYDTIVIFPTWPPGSEFNTDDWLPLVFTHEFTHIVHLDRSASWARVVRGMFGRTPVAFPNLFLPTWQIEGLATYEESAVTGEGRLHAGDFRAIVDEAARTGRLEPLDRVNGGLTDWPAGQAAYAYGAAFHEFLADRFGAERLGELGDATARRVPYTASASFKKVFGQSLGSLWRDFEAARTANARTAARDSAVTRLTWSGFVVAAPRFDRHCERCRPSIVYTERTPDGFPSLKRLDVDGGGTTTLTTRYLGATTALGKHNLYFDQLEVSRAVGLYGDLFELSRDSSRVTRLTHGLRLHDPDLSPDGTTIAAVQENASRRDLVLVHLTPTISVEAVAGGPDIHFNAPRWSPTGDRIAVERHRRGADPEIVIVDTATRLLEVLLPAPGTRIVMPAWRPDGRTIVAAVAIGDEPFNLVDIDLDHQRSRRLTDLGGGATWPDVSPDGRTVVFVGYTTAGHDLFTITLPESSVEWQPATIIAAWPSEPAFVIDGALTDGRANAAPTASYSPLPTLKPTSWSPVVQWDTDQVRIGAATGGVDVLGYHAYSVSASWLVASPAEAAAPDRAVPDWFVSYAYDRWQPTFFATASAQTSFFAGPAASAGTPSTATRRERQVEGGVLFPIVRVRSSHEALATFFRSADDYTLADRDLRRDRAGLRAAWMTTTARTYGYSISPEDGLHTGATAEFVRIGLGASADATTFTGDIRAFLPGLAPHHIVAARLAGGTSTGDRTAGRTFLLGGAGPDASPIDFGSSAVSLLRGFAPNSFAGSHVALADLEYRLPIARPQRGAGTWPLFLHTIHAAVFADVGHAWTRRFAARDLKTSVGAELSANLVAGYHFPLTLTFGTARGYDGSGTVRDSTSVYVRVGRSF